jgi:MFS family permease
MVAGMVGAGISMGIILGFIPPRPLSGSSATGATPSAGSPSFPYHFRAVSSHQLHHRTQIHETVAAEHDSNHVQSDLSIAFKSLPTYIGIICMFLFTWVMNAFNDLTPGFIAIAPPTGLGLGPAAAGRFMSAVQIGMLIGSAASGFILMKIFSGRIKAVMFTGFLLTAVFMFSVKLPTVHSTPTLLAITLFLAGFFEAFIIPMVATFIATNYPSSIMAESSERPSASAFSAAPSACLSVQPSSTSPEHTWFPSPWSALSPFWEWWPPFG